MCRRLNLTRTSERRSRDLERRESRCRPDLSPRGRRTGAGSHRGSRRTLFVGCPRRETTANKAALWRDQLSLKTRTRIPSRAVSCAFERGLRWRRRWDSNPRKPFNFAGFQVRCLQPLDHSPERWPGSIREPRRTYKIGVKSRLPLQFASQPGVEAAQECAGVTGARASV